VATAARQEGLKRVPADEESWIARGVARVADDPRGALDDFRAAVKLNPRSLAGLHNQAHVLSEHLRQPRAAVAILDQVLRLHPDLVAAWAGRGVLRARLGLRAEAHRDALQALAREGDAGETLFQVAGIYALTSRSQASDRDEAFRLLGRALQTGYGFDLLESDADLAPLRKEARFRNLVRAARTLKEAAR
jgi:eukaryotic-like serine/threonine-protein kinase